MHKGLTARLKDAIKRPHADVHPADMEWVGISNIMRAAKLLNRGRYGGVLRSRRRLHQTDGERLLAENGLDPADHGVMRDGTLLDTSCSWPHLDGLLAQCEEIIAQNGMTRRGVAGREWIRDIMTWSFIETHPALLDFITSSDIARIADEYLGYIPSLSTTVPPGLRLTESETSEEDLKAYRGSQLFHLDIHDTPMVYVIVLIREVTEQGGPFHYLPASATARVVRALGYQKRRKPFRLRDEDVYAVVDRSEVKMLTGRAGTVLFLDPSRCLHFGSRDVTIPRYQAMYALVSPCRADFTEWYLAPRAYPRSPNDSAIRRLMLDNRSTH